jgi:hypothetical protein
MRHTAASAEALSKPHELDEIGAPVEVRRHPSARRLTLRVSRTRRAVIVTLPVQCDLDEADSFIIRNIEWVRERLDNVPHPVPFHDGALMPLRGEIHRLVFARKREAGGGVHRSKPATGFPELRVGGHVEHAQRRLRDWLLEEARRDLDARIAHHSRKLGVTAKRIAVRDQSSRWGSCSTTGVLSFSWRLVLAPPFVLDYVAAHEIAHLIEMNHGPKFWALVEKTMPRTQEAKHWLQRYGLDLHRYGPAERKSG